MNSDACELEATDEPVEGGSRWRVRRDESGLVLVWTSLFLMVLLGFAALAVDLGHAYFVGQKAQNAVDAAALAGAVYLPGDLAGAQAAAQELAAANGFTNGVNGVTVTATQGIDPIELNVTVRQDVPTWFAKAIGFDMMNVSKSGAAVADQPTATPVDLMLILDRTGSMTPTDLANVKDASNALLGVLNPSNTHVALGLLGPSETTVGCSANNTSGAYGIAARNPALGTWIVSPFPGAPFASDYQNADGTLNTASQIVKTITCLDRFGRTDLGTPVQQAQAYFAAHGRPGAKQGLILMTDGAANLPNNASCKFAFDQATNAKAAGIEMVTIAFGVGDDSCLDVSSSPYANGTPGDAVTGLLADMASPANAAPSDDDLGCTDAENADGDNFFCEPKSGDLSSVFILAAGNLTQSTPRLIK